MSDRPVFIYAATYGNRDDALADYDTLADLHEAKPVATYDVAVISKDAEGKVHVEKHEKPTSMAPGEAQRSGRSSGFFSRLA